MFSLQRVICHTFVCPSLGSDKEERDEHISAVASRLSQRPAWADWFGNPDLSGGAVLDLLIHDLDALNWIFGKPRTVYARGRKTRRGAWDHILTIVDYGKAHGLIEGNAFMPPGYPFTMTLKYYANAGVLNALFALPVSASNWAAARS